MTKITAILVKSFAQDKTGIITIESADQLQAALKRLESDAQQKPFMADLTLANGDTLSIGLGRNVSVLSFAGRSGNPPYYLSVGNKDADRAKVIEFDYYDHWSEFPLSAAIPIEQAKNALLYFYETGKLASDLKWSEG